MNPNENEADLSPENNENSLLQTLESIKPMMNDFMKMLQQNVNKSNTNNHECCISTSEESGSEETDSGESVEESEPKPLLTQKLNSVFDMLGPILKNMDKYKDKPYLGMMPTIFNALSKFESKEGVAETEVESMRTNASTVSDMLKDKAIDELYEVPEFREAVYQVTVNFNRVAVFAVKKQLEKMESELSELNEETDVDVLLQNLHSKFSKK